MNWWTIAAILTVLAIIISAIISATTTNQDTKENADIAQGVFGCVSCLLLVVGLFLLVKGRQ